jgi:hypothetical protein
MRPLPEAEASFGSTVPAAESRSASVVSHHHDGLLRTEVTGLLHPATGQGFAAFHASQPQSSPRATLDTVGSSRDAVHTLRRLSLASSRTASLRPLPSCRYRPAPGASPSRSREAYRPNPAETGPEQPCARPPRRVSHPSPCVELLTPRREWATVCAEAGGPASEETGLPVSEKRGVGPPKKPGDSPREGANWTAEARDGIQMR